MSGGRLSLGRLRLLALALTVVSGFSGLVYEVAWQRILATLLGSHSEATAAVLGLFLGGLAVGYALFGRFTQRRLARAEERPPHLLLAYGLLEAAIGVWALLFPLLFRGIQQLSFAVPHSAGGLGFAFDVALSAILVLPPTVLMGATIPILTQALSSRLDDATRVHAWVYGFNSAGAVVGALCAGYWFIPSWGLAGTLAAMGLVNVAVGAVFVWVGRRPDTAGEASRAADATRPATVPGFMGLAAAALLVGSAMMAVQTILNRLGALAFGASQFTFSMIVAVFVLCISIGSLLVSLLPRVPPWLLAANLWALVLSLLLLYPQLQDAPYWVHALRALMRDEPAGFALYQALSFTLVLMVTAVPVALSGATLPLIFDHLRSRVGELGHVAGRLYSLNTLGSLLGALVGGYVLLFWLDLDQIFRFSLLALIVAAALVSRESGWGWRRVLPAVLLPTLVVLALPRWDPARLSAGLHRQKAPLPESFLGPDALFAARAEERTVEFYDDDPVASIAVVDFHAPPSRAIMTNGKSDGAVPVDYETTTLLGLLPALMSDRVERSFVIGFGTGVTAGVLAHLRSMREVVIAEISPAVLEAALLFEDRNGGPLAFPGTRIVRSDAFRALMRSDARYDVIVSEPSNPWVTGVEMLYSREFLQAVRDRLAPGGVYAHFFHTYEADRATIDMVLRTFASVFEGASVWVSQGVDLILIGSDDPRRAPDLARMEERFRSPDYHESFERAGITYFLQLLAHELMPSGVLDALGLRGELHTLLHPRLSHSAGRAFFVGQGGVLPSIARPDIARAAARGSLFRRQLARTGRPPSEPERLAIAASLCHRASPGCMTQLAHWRHVVPVSASRSRLESELAGAGRIDLALVEELAALYGIEAGEGSFRPPEARRATQLFALHYHVTAPFPADAPMLVWERCRGPGGAGCPRARAKALAELGWGDADDGGP